MAKIQENIYYQSNEISNSKLSLINPEQGGSPSFYLAVNSNTMEKKENMSLERGKLVHYYQLEPDSFKTADVIKPTPGIQAVLDDMYLKGDKSLGFCKQELILAANRTGFQKNWGVDAKLKQLDIKENKKYYNYLLESEEYIFLSTVEKHIVENSLTSIKQHPYANKLMNGDEWDYDEVFNEHYISAVDPRTGLQVKGLLDRMLVKHKEKKIIIPDLKTTSKAVDLFGVYYKAYRYYRQHAFYGHLVKLSDPKYKDYHIEYLSVVVNVQPGGMFETRVFDIHPDWIQKGKEEFNNLLDRVKYHVDTNQWLLPMEHEKGFDTIMFE